MFLFFLLTNADHDYIYWEEEEERDEIECNKKRLVYFRYLSIWFSVLYTYTLFIVFETKIGRFFSFALSHSVSSLFIYLKQQFAPSFFFFFFVASPPICKKIYLTKLIVLLIFLFILLSLLIDLTITYFEMKTRIYIYFLINYISRNEKLFKTISFNSNNKNSKIRLSNNVNSFRVCFVEL